MKIQFTGFEKYTGECLASCGGWADSGHKPDCELGQVAAELERLERIEKAAKKLLDYRKQSGPLNFQLEKADAYMHDIRIAMEGGKK